VTPSGVDDDVVRALVALTVAHRDARRTEPAAALERWVRQQRALGAVGLRPHPKAALLVGSPQVRMSGPTQPVLIAVDPGDPAAVDALLKALAGFVPFDTSATLVLDTAWRGLLPGLRELGLVPCFVELEGTRRDAMRALADRSIPDLPVRAGLPEDLPDLLALRRAVFSAEPASGFGAAEIGHRDAIEAGVRYLLERALAGAGHVAVLEDGPRPVGFAAATLRDGRPPVANVMVAIDPRHRGRGATWALYRAVLAGLPAVDDLRIIGQTRHPAVHHVATAMGRWVRAVVLRGAGPRLPDGLL
jgi:hypothetical protein